MEGIHKAILRIDCESASQEDALTQNEAARSVLNQGNAGAVHQQDKDEITVQYNPASIKYRAGMSESSKIKYETQGKTDYKITTITGESNMDMSFTLVFHSRFAGDRSVREQMELLLEMIRKSPTKQVDFSWSHIHLEGRLTSFSGEYDMFDRDGIPVSGHMDLTIETSTKVERTSKTLLNIDKSDHRADTAKI